MGREPEEMAPAPASVQDAPSLAEADLYHLLLMDKRSENTRRAYAADLKDFFLAVFEKEPSEGVVRQFLMQDSSVMAHQLLAYKVRLMERGLAEATVNRRLAAVRSLVRLARQIGITDAVLEGRVSGERVRPYRDTRGVDAQAARRILRALEKATDIAGRRDYVILLLLLENALRRNEVVSLRVRDYDGEEGVLFIRGKGRGTQRECVVLSPKCRCALNRYIEMCGLLSVPDTPLFMSLSPARKGKALTADGLYKIVRERALEAGISQQVSPHRLRHTAITLALDLSGGDIRRVQRLSRHARLETLRIYDDNRQALQGEVSCALSRFLGEGEE